MKDSLTIVYIGGFLVPEGRMPYRTDTLPANIKVIPVFPSGAASLHDRVVQVFYELKGGTEEFGKEHSEFHGHNSLGTTHSGKFPEWSEDNPIHIVGHSFGGLTGRVLESYLTSGNMFGSHKTNSRWVVSIASINGPLNGGIMDYSLGANLTLAPVVRWGSLGCIVGWLVHFFEYIDSQKLRKVYDFKCGK